MASFTAFLEVSGRQYPLYRYELRMHQETDTLGRPASPVLGGTISCTLLSPGSTDPFLYQWMLSPTMQQDGRIILLQATSRATEKTISFFNAYCTNMDLGFQPGRNGGTGSNGIPSSLIQLQISPQRIAVGAIVHDNNWPVPSHGAGETFTQPAPPASALAASRLSDRSGSEAVTSTTAIPPLNKVADNDPSGLPPGASHSPASRSDAHPSDASQTPATPRLATEAEAEQLRKTKAQLLERTPELRASANVATAAGAIDGRPINLMANSSKVTAEGTVPHKLPNDQILKTGPTANDIAKGKTHPNIRAYDSEAKLCEAILDQTTPESTGDITITSENEPCDSCEDVITKQMSELRPGIKINVVYVQPYKNK